MSKKPLYGWKGLVPRKAHVNYKSPKLNSIKVTGNVKRVCNRQTDGQTDEMTDRQTGQTLYDPKL